MDGAWERIEMRTKFSRERGHLNNSNGQKNNLKCIVKN